MGQPSNQRTQENRRSRETSDPSSLTSPNNTQLYLSIQLQRHHWPVLLNPTSPMEWDSVLHLDNSQALEKWLMVSG